MMCDKSCVRQGQTQIQSLGSLEREERRDQEERYDAFGATREGSEERSHDF